MNERIRELAEQAWDHLIDEMGDVISEDGSLNSDFLHAYVQRFAELIVQECADIAEKWYSDYPSDDRLLSDAVKQHFGVE